MIKLNKLIITLGLLLILSYTSCHLLRKPSVSPEKQPDIEAFQNIRNTNVEFETFQARMSVNARMNTQSQSLSANVRLKKDSIIWISIAPFLGIELFRAVITPDSIKAINRIERTYFTEDSEVINNILNTSLNFEMIQAVLLGNDFSGFTHESIHSSIEEEQYQVFLKNRRPGAYQSNPFNHTIWFDPAIEKISRHLLEDIKENYTFDVKYADFRNIDLGIIPFEMSISALSNQGIINMDINYSRVHFNREVSFPFNVPKRYKKIHN